MSDDGYEGAGGEPPGRGGASPASGGGGAGPGAESGQSLVVPVHEVRLLLRYALERGLDPSAAITGPLQAALYDYEHANAGSDEEKQAGQELLRQYGALAAKSYEKHEVNGRTIRETQSVSRGPFWYVLLAGIAFLVFAMGTEMWDLFLEDYLEPEDETKQLLINIHRYVLTYLSPFLWGGLGACVYLVKRLADARAQLKFERQRYQGLAARIGIGALLGAVVVLIYDPTNFTEVGFNLDANSLAFFVGVGVKVFYRLIESTIETVAEGLRRRITGEAGGA